MIDPTANKILDVGIAFASALYSVALLILMVRIRRARRRGR